MKWTKTELEKRKKAGTIQGWEEKQPAKESETTRQAKKLLRESMKKPAKEIKAMCQALTDAGIPYETEYYFAKPRMFRFDIAVPGLMLAIEYEGLVATGKKGGHQTKKGYTSNCTKYNLAAQKGWTVLRYTYKNYRDFTDDLKTFLR